MLEMRVMERSQRQPGEGHVHFLHLIVILVVNHELFKEVLGLGFR